MNQKFEKEIQDKSLNAPRLTPDHVESKVQAIRYLTGDVAPIFAHEDYFAKEDKTHHA